MKILLCIDDTDNLESRGTGEIASLIAEALHKNGWGKVGMVTRHQLFVHPDIPYTSHNSAMCFTADIDDGSLGKVVDFAGAFLDEESAPGSDPGLCVAQLDRLGDAAELIDFGQRAKREVLTMADAYALAQRLGVHLSEHGGSGQGVIGALAGAGLRLSGNDGRMKGALQVEGRSVMTVAELLEHPDVDVVRSPEGEVPRHDEKVQIGEKPKTVLLQGASVLLVIRSEREEGGAPWQTAHRRLLKSY